MHRRSRSFSSAESPASPPGEVANIAAPVGLFQVLPRISKPEADLHLLGIQYLYKTGYDPTAAIDMFERIRSHRAQTSRRRLAIVQHSPPHFPTASPRLSKTSIRICRQRPEYIVNTSEYEDVRAPAGEPAKILRKVVAKPTPTLLKKAADAKDEPPTLKRPE